MISRIAIVVSSIAHFPKPPAQGIGSLVKYYGSILYNSFEKSLNALGVLSLLYNKATNSSRLIASRPNIKLPLPMAGSGLAAIEFQAPRKSFLIKLKISHGV